MYESVSVYNRILLNSSVLFFLYLCTRIYSRIEIRSVCSRDIKYNKKTKKSTTKKKTFYTFSTLKYTHTRIYVHRHIHNILYVLWVCSRDEKLYYGTFQCLSFKHKENVKKKFLR